MHLPLDCTNEASLVHHEAAHWVGMEQVKSNRGFASMDRARQREIASKGGHGVPPEKRSFSKNRQLAAEAGRKGGEAVPAAERSFSQNRELAAAAGRKGGESRAQLFNPRHEAARRRQLKKEDEERDDEQLEQEQRQEETTETA
jgi:general stress protein YciG